jgi:hypothetical protein
MSKGRTALAVGIIGAVLALVLGLFSAPASARTMARTKIVITSTSPAQPVGGQNYTMRFEIRKAGVTVPMKALDCYAQSGGRVVPLVNKGTNGMQGFCTWAVPSGASGKTLDGIIAAQRDTGTWYYRGFDLAVS